MKPKGYSTRNIIIKIVKVKNKDRILKEARKTDLLHTREDS